MGSLQGSSSFTASVGHKPCRLSHHCKLHVKWFCPACLSISLALHACQSDCLSNGLALPAGILQPCSMCWKAGHSMCIASAARSSNSSGCKQCMLSSWVGEHGEYGFMPSCRWQGRKGKQQPRLRHIGGELHSGSAYQPGLRWASPCCAVL